MRLRRRRQQGVSLIITTFIIVGLSILAAALVQILTASSDAVAREVLSARAFFAAESGAQRMLNEIYQGDESNCADAVNTPKTHTYNDFDALSGCGGVVVVCSYIDNTPALSTNVYYTITSAGVCGPVAEQASRSVEVQAKNI